MYFLNVLGLLGNTRNVWKNEGSCSAETFSLVVLKVIQASIDHCEVPANLDLNNSARSWNLTVPSSSR